MIPVNTPLLDGNEKKYLIECVETGWISSEGPFITRFEQDFAAYVQRKHAIAVSNGSVALDAAFLALDLEPGSEVILPSFTIISCAAAIVRAGCVPVAVDADPDTWNIDIAQIESRITAKTRAILVVHIYGLPCDMDPIEALAQKYNLQIVEDAAEMHGQTYRGRRCGSFGAISTFSFYPNKLITTGEGGMVLTDSDELAERCRSLRNLCFTPRRRFVHDELGYNWRMTNIQAALGVAQLERIDFILDRKREIGRRYTELLADIPNVRLPLARTSYADSIYWVYGLVLPPDAPFDATEAMRRLGELGIGTRPFFWPMHEQPALHKLGYLQDQQLPVSEHIARYGFYIPSGLALTNEEIEVVAAAVNKVLRF